MSREHFSGRTVYVPVDDASRVQVLDDEDDLGRVEASPLLVESLRLMEPTVRTLPTDEEQRTGKKRKKKEIDMCLSYLLEVVEEFSAVDVIEDDVQLPLRLEREAHVDHERVLD
jgi:hypothetical protein